MHNKATTTTENAQTGSADFFTGNTDSNFFEPSRRVHKYEMIPNARASVKTLDNVMEDYIRYTVQLCNAKISGHDGAAELLKINPNTLRNWMNKLGIPYGRKCVRPPDGK